MLRAAEQLANRAGSWAWLHEEIAGEFEKRDRICLIFVSTGTSLLGGVAVSFLTRTGTATSFVLSVQWLSLAFGVMGMIGSAFSRRTQAAQHSKLAGKNAALFTQMSKAQLNKNGLGPLYEYGLDMEAGARRDRAQLHIPEKVFSRYSQLFGTAALSRAELYLISCSNETDGMEPVPRTVHPERPQRSTRSFSLVGTPAQTFELRRYACQDSL